MTKAREQWEAKVPYIVKLKEGSSALYGTTCYNKFCGYLVNFTNSNFYFEINGIRMLVIVNHNEIEWMGPNNDCFKAETERLRESNL